MLSRLQRLASNALALALLFGVAQPAHATGAPPCMGDRPAVFATPLPARAFPGDRVVLEGVGLQHYQSPVVVLDSGGRTALRVTGTVVGNRAIAFDVPPITPPAPVSYRVEIEDAVLTHSPAVCARFNNGQFQGTYAVRTDADCGSDPVLCHAAPDNLRSLTYATLEVVPPMQQTPDRMARISINDTNLPANPLCSGSIPRIAELGAFFDENANGIVDGFPSASPTVNFPADLVVNVTSSLGYDIVQGSMYAAGAGTRANLVVVAGIFTCPHNGPQFVAVHFALYGNPGSVTVEPIRMLAGDNFDTIGTVEGPQKGVVMLGGFDGSLDQAKLSAGIVEGRAAGSVTQATSIAQYGARIEFEFTVPAELR